MPAATAPLFDPRTIIVMASVMSLMMAGVMFFLHRIYPPNIHGLRHWSIAPFLCCISTFLFAMRGLIPDLVSSAVGNLILLFGAVVFYWGSQRFHDIAPRYRIWGAALVASAPLFVWFLEVDPRYEVRVILFTAIMLSIMGAHARLLLVVSTTNVFTRPVGYLLVLQCAFLLLRMVDALRGKSVAGLLDASGGQITYLMAYTFTFLLLSVALILMAAERMRMEFAHIARHDSLTLALSRRAWLENCERELERCHRHGHGMALAMMDLDHFKAINDTHGHQAGDQVLVDFSQRVSRQLRQSDRLGRFGGEEFVLLLPEASLDEAMGVAQRIRNSRTQVPGLPPCTVSIGVASYEDGTDTIASLLARADAALYRAKNGGRNRVESSMPP